ncbi:helix-turn-helix domain-containing protein [Pedobacter glucosidilyticus]|uniref:helix-turn-helix domain-containing protein n=1 Tax=Pedobacter glucosidilyticus TaxID=1122941 RepID=UPI0026EE7994|nr:helix-turn-helix transcriptional regulator [Pedobacter glucosidilyticus]
MSQTSVLSKNIVAFRKHMGLTQDALAQFLGVQREMISYFESGSREPSAEILLKLADLFGCDLEDLLEDNPEAINTCLAFAFRAEDLAVEDLATIAEFKKIVKNYLTLSNLKLGSQS